MEKEFHKKTLSRINNSFSDSPSTIPSHVAVIMDGNRRWASGKRMPIFSGHKAGTRNIKDLLALMIDLDISFLTLFAFSTENWNRPENEVNYITKILLPESLAENFEDLHKMGVKILIKGSVEKLDNKLRKKILNAVSKTENNNKISLIIAFDYGGRKEIINAIKKILDEDLLQSDINEAKFTKYLDSDGIPDPDLIIRTGGEYRLSNFLIWQSAYSEFYTSKVLWPDFGIMDLSEALIEYSKRIRRFGIQ